MNSYLPMFHEWYIEKQPVLKWGTLSILKYGIFESGHEVVPLTTCPMSVYHGTQIYTFHRPNL